MSDILTRLLLDTKDFESKLGKAKGSTNSFASDISGKLVGAVGKLAAGLGVAMGASEAFERVMKSSQTTSDKYAETLQILKTGVDSFFYSISSGDWSSFLTGMDTVIAKAKEAYSAMDQLGNAQMSFGVAQAINQRDIANAQQLAKNKFAPLDVRIGAFGEWATAIGTQESQSEQLKSDIQNFITKAVESKAGIKGFEANMDNVMKGLLLDIQKKGSRERLKELYSGQYSDFESELEAAAKERSRRRRSSNLFERNTAESYYEDAVKRLTSKYNEAITIQSLLVKYGDDDLQAIGNHVKSMIGLDNSIAMLKREYNETANEFNNANKGVQGFEPLKAFEGYTVYSGTSEASKNFNGGGSSSSTKVKIPVALSQVSYDTPLGKKVLEWMNGKEFKPIHVPVVIEEDIDEEDLSGKWGEHLAKEEKKVEDMNTALSATADIFGNLGSIAGASGEDFLAASFSMMGNIAQMILQLQALTTAQGVSSASKLPFPANLAAIATVVATIASIFSSLPKFAEGGVVGGSSFFGDKLIARVNSGETILTPKMAARALSMMDGNNVRVSGDVRLNGKDIYISLRNYMSSSGNRL